MNILRGQRLKQMAVLFSARMTICFLIMIIAAGVHGFPATLKLERMSPTNQEIELSEIRARDGIRHGRLLESLGGVVNFPIKGNADPSIIGLYYTKLNLGSPPREFNVQIDTGSDALWVSCKSCNDCPKTKLSFFDPSTSLTASLISCSDKRCDIGSWSPNSECSLQNNLCGYNFQYGDGSFASGFYVSDIMYLDTMIGTTLTANSTPSIIFGCSNSQAGDWGGSGKTMDGIFGFGQQGLSVISQLASRGLTPRVFSHCLKGDDSGGGALILGEIVDPKIVYTPLIPSQQHYNVDLHSISVNDQILSIDPSVFSISTSQGTIIDSGTTLTYLPEAAYDPLVQTITDVTSGCAHPIFSNGHQCYILTSRDNVDDIFPRLSFNFEGNASMVLYPHGYLLQQISMGGTRMWCIGFAKMQADRLTILGDVVLKDKIFVYDLDRQRIGWTDYDCSLPVNVSATGANRRDDFIDAGWLAENASPCNMSSRLLTKSLIPLFIQIVFFYCTRVFF